MITTKKGVLIIFVACFLAIARSVVLADGGGNPPPAAGSYKNVPPPYKGNVTVELVASCSVGGETYTGCALLTGTLTKLGKEDIQCAMDEAVFETGVQQKIFESHTEKGLKGRQIVGAHVGCPGTTIGTIYEIIVAHNLSYNTENTLFTVDLTVMEMVPK